jgi:hypothetical protein
MIANPTTSQIWKKSTWHNYFYYVDFLICSLRNLSLKQGSLFCFVLFYHVEVSKTTMFHAVLLVALESSQWVKVHRLGLRLFVAIVWKLLIIEPFLNENQINCLVLLESLQGVRFNKFYFRIFRAKVWKILIFEWILLLEIQTNCKNRGFKGKFSWSPQCAHNVNLEIFNCEN